MRTLLITVFEQRGLCVTERVSVMHIAFTNTRNAPEFREFSIVTFHDSKEKLIPSMYHFRRRMSRQECPISIMGKEFFMESDSKKINSSGELFDLHNLQLSQDKSPDEKKQQYLNQTESDTHHKVGKVKVECVYGDIPLENVLHDMLTG